MRKPLGYIPTLHELHFVFDAKTYSGRHRPGWTWARAIHRARGRLMSVRAWFSRKLTTAIAGTSAPVRTLTRAIMSLRASKPVPRPAITLDTAATQIISLGRQPAVRQLRSFLRTRVNASRESAPSAHAGRPRGVHRLERLSSMGNIDYLRAMSARTAYVTATLARLAELANGPRAFGEMTWREGARNADRYASA